MADSDREDPNNPRLSVMQFIATLGEGNTVLEIQSALVETAKAVELTKKKGKVTLEIDFAYCAQAQKAVLVLGTVKAKVPKLPPVGRIMFVDAEGGLRHHDVQQRQMDLRPRAVPSPNDPPLPKAFDGTTGEVLQ